MSATHATQLLRPGLLNGVSLFLAGPPPPADAMALAVAQAFSNLGARVCRCVPDIEDEPAMDQAVAGALAEANTFDTLVVDGAGLFDAAVALGVNSGVTSEGGATAESDSIAAGRPTEATGHAALRACMDATWNVTRALINQAFLPAESDSPARRIVYLAPSATGEHAAAVRAGLENLARTLSVEWARHGITTVCIASAAQTPAQEVAALTAYLASPAGAYFSGCLLDLGRAVNSTAP